MDYYILIGIIVFVVMVAFAEELHVRDVIEMALVASFWAFTAALVIMMWAGYWCMVAWGKVMSDD